MDIQIKWNKPIEKISEEKAGGKEGLLFLANETKRLMDPYVPADNLVLAQNVRLYVEGDIGIVEYNSPYSHYQWKGEKYVDPETGISGFQIPGVGWRSRKSVAKKPSGKKLNHSKFRHPMATSHWDTAMKKARMGELTGAYQEYLNGGKHDKA